MTYQPKKGKNYMMVGDILREWRQLKKVSQMELALSADVSTRHLSFVETGRAQPSRNLILKISESLNLPFRQRNVLLKSAGYAIEFRDRPFESEELEVVQQTLSRIIKLHEPFPALVVDTAYDILMANAGFEHVVKYFAGENALRKYDNIYRLVFSPDGLSSSFTDWPVIDRFLCARLYDEVVSTQNEKLIELHEEILALKISEESEDVKIKRDVPVMNFSLQKSGVTVSFFSTITTFGTPLDVTTQELKIESLYPADDETREFFNEIV